MSVTVKQYKNNNQNDWENFIDISTSNKSIFFLRKFLSYHNDNKFNDHSLLIYNKNNLIGLLPAAVNNMRSLISHPGLSHGSFALRLGLGIEDILEIISAVQEYIRENRFTGLLINSQPLIYSRQQSSYLDFALLRLGFINYCTDLTNYISIDSPEEMCGRYSDSCQRAIKKAKKSELKFSESNDYTGFYRILESNLMQRHNVSPTHTIEEMHMLKDLFPAAIKLFTVSYKGTIISGTVAFRINSSTQLLFYIAHDPTFQEMRPVNLLISEVNIWCYKNKYKILDLGKFTLNGEPNFTLARFKESFGSTGTFRNKYRWESNNEK